MVPLNSTAFPIIEIDPANRHQRELFLRLPFRLYRETPQWVPPLEMDIRPLFNRRKHPFYQTGDAGFFLAMAPGEGVIGRLAVLYNRKYNEFNHEKTAFFTMFECENNPEAACALFEAAFSWARAHQLDRLVGPKGFSILDGMGLLVKGFEHRPAFGLPYHLPYYASLVEAAGLTPINDTVSGYLEVSRIAFPEKIRKAAELVQKRRGFRIVRFKNRREFARVIPGLQDLYNRSLDGTTGNMPLSAAEVKNMANQLLWFANPRLIKLIMKDDELIGFLLAYPDISAAVQRTRGRLFPFGWVDLLLERSRTRWVNINGAAIVEKYRGLGGTAILFNEMYQSILEGNFLHADLVQIGVENEKMQRELRDLGIDFYKVHRIYEKSL